MSVPRAVLGVLGLTDRICDGSMPAFLEDYTYERAYGVWRADTA
jgi:hypothetical protein